MSYLHNKSGYFALGLMLALLSGIMLFGFTQVAHADEHGIGHHEFMDSRHGHNHAYPARGQFIGALPGGHRVVFYGNARYYFHGGVWYRPQGRRFVIVAPPFGIIVPVLPPYYATVMLGGVPYYYANEVYYTQTAGGYVVVAPPQGEVSQAPPAPSASPSVGQMSSDKLFLYPRKGQSEQQQAKDRYECHNWAVNQTGYDLTQLPAGAAQMSQKRADYQRAMGACLDGRGYTVK